MKNSSIRKGLGIISIILTLTMLLTAQLYADENTGESYFSSEKYNLKSSKLYTSDMEFLEECLKSKGSIIIDAFHIDNIAGMSGSSISGFWESTINGEDYYIEASDVEMKLSRDDLSSTIQAQTISIYSNDDKFIMDYEKESIDGKLSEKLIVAKDNGISVNLNNDGTHINKDYKDVPYRFSMPENVVKKLKPSESVTWSTFDDSKMDIKKISGILTKTEDGFLFETTDSDGSKSRGFYDKNMSLQKLSTLGIEIKKCSLEIAVNDRLEGVKGVVKTSWTSDCVLPQIKEMNYLKLKVKPKSDEVRLVSNERQNVIMTSENSYDLLVINSPQKEPKEKVISINEYLDKDEINAALKPEKLYESDSPEIKAKAQEIIGDEKDIFLQSVKLAKWVDENILGTYEVGAGSAIETLKSRKGDCSESAALFIAMARSVGIPTRQVTGLKTLGSEYESHAWAEVFIGRWIEIDPSTGELPDVGYIRFAEGSYDFVPGVIEILEFGYGEEKIIVDKERPYWDFDGAIYNNRIWGISAKVPKGFNFGISGDKSYLNIPKKGNVPPKDESASLFALQVDQELANKGILGMIITAESISSKAIFKSVALDGRINGIQYGDHGTIKQNEKEYLVYEVDIDSKMKAIIYQAHVGQNLYVDCMCIGKDIKENYWNKLPESVLQLFDSIKKTKADIGKVIEVNDDIKVYLKEKKLSFDVEPIVNNGRVLVPMRGIFEAIGAELSWDDVSKTVTAIQNDNKIVVTIDNTEAIVNDKSMKLDVPAKIIHGRTLVPLRFVGEGLGLRVNWDGDTRTINID